MKGIFAVILCAFMLANTAMTMAQGEAASLDYRGGMRILAELNGIVETMHNVEPDSDTQEILSYINYQLSLINAGLTITIPDEAKLQDYDLFSLEENNIEYSDEYYSIDPIYIPEIGCCQGYTISKKGNYTRIESTVYDQELREQYEFVRIEHAIRPETTEHMILLTLLKYDDIMTSSNRYLVYSDGSVVKSLFRRTFSTDEEYRIDVALWAEGKNYEWSTELLYPNK